MRDGHDPVLGAGVTAPTTQQSPAGGSAGDALQDISSEPESAGRVAPVTTSQS